MDPGYRSPLIDLFMRGDAARDIRLLAAQGALSTVAHEQLALLVLLTDDQDIEVAHTARATLEALPPAALRVFLAGPGVPEAMKQFFAARGVAPAATATSASASTASSAEGPTPAASAPGASASNALNPPAPAPAASSSAASTAAAPIPVASAPAAPAPVAPAPVTSSPVAPVPVAPAPVASSPVASAPVAPAPAAAPVTSSPVAPVPVAPAPAASSPVAPIPVAPSAPAQGQVNSTPAAAPSSPAAGASGSVQAEGDEQDDDDDDDDDVAAIGDKAAPTLLAGLPIKKKIKLASKGTREQRAQLIRDPNKLVAAAVLSSPKLTDAEVEAFSKMQNVTEEVLRVIGMNRTWLKNYGVILGLVKNAKTPAAISMQLLQRVNERDMKMLAVDRNVPESLRLAARKFMVKNLK
jgi:hypothetical protein